MPQLVGSRCVACGKTINTIIEGDFCPACGHPVHNACRRPPGEDEPNRCATCGIDLGSAGPPPSDPVLDEGGLPVGWTCPRCGSDDYRPARSVSLIAFAPDRLCRRCGTRYVRPTPRWAGVVFILLGLLFAAGALICSWLLVQGLREGNRRVVKLAIGIAASAAVAGTVLWKGVHVLRASGRIERPGPSRGT